MTWTSARSARFSSSSSWFTPAHPEPRRAAARARAARELGRLGVRDTARVRARSRRRAAPRGGAGASLRARTRAPRPRRAVELVQRARRPRPDLARWARARRTNGRGLRGRSRRAPGGARDRGPAPGLGRGRAPPAEKAAVGRAFGSLGSSRAGTERRAIPRLRGARCRRIPADGRARRTGRATLERRCARPASGDAGARRSRGGRDGDLSRAPGLRLGGAPSSRGRAFIARTRTCRRFPVFVRSVRTTSS